MRYIDLDGANWRTPTDFNKALLPAIGAPHWHGMSIDALLDSMIWGGINALEPPYTVRVRNLSNAPKDVVAHVELLRHELATARMEYQAQRGSDVDVSLEILS